MLHYVYSQLAILCYQDLLGQELLRFWVDKLESFPQLVSNEISNYKPDIL